MKQKIHFIPSSERHHSKKLILFLTFIFLCCLIFCSLLRFFYESYFLLYRQTKKIYVPKKQFISTASEQDITQLKQQVAKKFQEKKKYQKMLQGRSQLFNYYQKIRNSLARTSTLTHCVVSSKTISLTAESQQQDEADRVLEQLQKEECFSTVKIRSSEKTGNNMYVYTIVITPKRSVPKVKKR